MMAMDVARARPLLKACDLQRLFIEELGWDHARQQSIVLTVSGQDYHLTAVAKKCGVAVYRCQSPAAGSAPVPDRNTRVKIHRELRKTAYEHVIVFVSPDCSTQVWQWVRYEPGRPIAPLEHPYHVTQPGDAILQKLRTLAVSLEQEEQGVSLTDMTRRTSAAFDVERVTKSFYDRFQKEHAAFLKFITGITESGDREWYASVMLNRLMFVYFIQLKGFLDGDRDYLRNRLNRLRTDHGKDKFYSFYRYFLLRLFHEGLGGHKRSTELEKLVGRIPYLNGGLFDVHEIEKPERYGKTIQIPDQAFERVFDYFDAFDWVLDPARTVRKPGDKEEINPDILGYIFEKYINQKQMGAYYTKEDITEYIGKNTMLPFLFDAARAKCKVAFENPKGPTVWDLLKDDPDRYIHRAVRHGVTWDYHAEHSQRGTPLERPHELPGDIAAGINPPTLHQPVGDGPVQTLELRKGWNKPAPLTHALRTETWREVIARRTRYEEVRAKLAAGEVRDINDLITLNLDVRQFAQDAIANCEGPDLLRAFWQAVKKVTILDPTCGSGAFLFAALNILEPLYKACLDRMEAFVADLDRSEGGHHPEKFSDFRRDMAHVAAHPNRDYFIFKSIILNNLYGVDIMEEAVEICKLRLFLKLAAQVDPDTARNNLGIEPLPDIDFNIRAGNTLVGYATYDEVKRAVSSKLDFENAMEKIAVKAADLQQAFDAFRARQVEGDGSVPPEDKQELRKRLKALDDELDRYLASEYGVEPSKKEAYAKWLKSHQPFHWFVEFYGIVNGGGFDVIIGNPPWKEYSSVKTTYTVRGYATEPSGNLYALCTERSLAMLSPRGFLSFIVQLPIVSSSRMDTMRGYLRRSASFIAAITCDDRPGKLFDGLQNCRSTIFVLQHRVGSSSLRLWSSGYRRWATSVRNSLFPVTAFAEVGDGDVQQGQFPKIASAFQASAYAKVFARENRSLGLATSDHTKSDFVFYQESARYWVKATVGIPHYAKNGRVGAPAHGRHLFFSDAQRAKIACAILHSSLFYTYFIAYGDCFHVSDTLATSLPVPPAALDDKRLDSLGAKLMRDLERNAEKKTINTKDGDKIAYDEFRVGESKAILDEIDQVLARHYGFTEEELDFIINYDIKYRMGRDTEGEEDC